MDVVFTTFKRRKAMGIRLRKSINLGGGFLVNVSKSGVGYSWELKELESQKKLMEIQGQLFQSQEQEFHM